jgi:signal transduction histidine kinase
VILNLVTNAVDALHARAKLDPNARQHLQVRGTQDTDEVCLEIMDSGSGIPTEIQARIFDPFFSTRRGSLGIGLSITKRLVEAQGGTLSVESGDQGSTFRVTLRRA